MNNTTRLVIALLLTGALAALATPQLATYLPEGLPTILAAALAAILHKMNAEAPAPAPALPDPSSPAKLTALPGGKEDES